MGGFFGVVSKERCINDLFYGTDYQSHLGTSRAGMATYSLDEGFFRSIHNLENDYFRSKFERELNKFGGTSGIGVISDTDAQPMLMNSHLGRFALVTVAKINNKDEICDHLLAENMHLSEFSSGKINITELIALLIIKGRDYVDGIENVFNTIKGSCSMLLLTENGIIAARDSWGRTPVTLGQKDGAVAVTTETTAFPNLGYETKLYLGPGQIIKITENGYEELRKPNKKMQICSFLWVYYGFPTSCYEGRNAEYVRNELGRVMGREDNVEVDGACGIPDSGLGMAVGYAEGHKCPYVRAVAKYTPTWPRSFMPTDQTRRNLVAKMKLISNKDILNGKRLVFCDDSIVRGTQLKDNSHDFYESGVKAAHMRISCPPLIFSCPFVNYSASKNDLELITRRVIQDFEGENPSLETLSKYATTGTHEYQRMVDEIARRLQLTTLKFSSIEALVKAIGLPKEKICTHCFDGSSFYTLEEDNK
ncbi:MAG: amidophosphoribosyltransferase [Bacteroidaceae bacterium]|nr:amidophosphoribosyltransferase [Bacteroidaceae bacterium]